MDQMCDLAFAPFSLSKARILYQLATPQVAVLITADLVWASRNQSLVGVGRVGYVYLPIYTDNLRVMGLGLVHIQHPDADTPIHCQ